MKVYTSKRWRGPGGTREQVLKRDHHICVLCGTPATHVDHQPPLTEQQALGISPYDAAYCRALCASCAGKADGHRSTTVTPVTPRPHPAPTTPAAIPNTGGGAWIA
jgi:5-methylcytosine-specific restriction endonuclease McrA